MDNLPEDISTKIFDSKASMEKMGLLVYVMDHDDVVRSDFLIERNMTDPKYMFTVRTRNITKVTDGTDTPKYKGTFGPPITIRSRESLTSLIQAYLVDSLTNLEDDEMDDDWITDIVHMCMYQSDSIIRDAISIDNIDTKRVEMAVIHCMQYVDAQMFTSTVKKVWVVLNPLMDFIGTNSI